MLTESRSGNTAAFGELVRRYEQKIAGVVIGMLGICDEADDVGQETFIRFYHTINNFRGEASLGTYLTRIAINLSLNELKRRKRRDFFFGSSDIQQDEPKHEEDFDQFDEKERVQRAIESLKPKLRAVVTLRLMEGYTTEETAEILSIPIGTVLSRLKRAQEKLQAILWNDR